MKVALVEFIGTFFLIFSIGVAAVLGVAGEWAPFAIVATLIGVIYAGGHISRAQYNPVITLAFFLTKRDSAKMALAIFAAEILAAVVASLIINTIFASTEVAKEVVTFPARNTATILTAEFIFTFGLTFVILNVAIARGTEGNGFYGLAIGAIVLGAILTVGSISLASLNPAVTLALIMMGVLNPVDCWMHLLPQVLAALLATYTFIYTAPMKD
ncbi:MAG: aquaporin [Verrucomicrobiota bacterium]